MLELVKEIISRFGGRPAGSKQEIAAQHFIKSKLEEYCTDVKTQPFKAALTGHFHSLKIFCVVFYASLLLYWVSIPLATIVAVINVVLFVGHFVTYRDWLDRFYPKQESLNVIGTLEPLGEVKSTVMIAGHSDCVIEFQWFYRLKHFAAILAFVSGFLFPLLAVFYVILWVFSINIPAHETDVADYVWVLFVILTPATLTYYTMHGEKPVDGAIDNLSAEAIMIETGRAFANKNVKGKSTLQHTRLKLISFGCEEAGLKGSQAYAKEFKEQILKEKGILLNVDSIKEKKELRILKGEVNTLIKFPKELVSKLEDAFRECNIPVKTLNLPMGATDATAFAMHKLPAVSIIGMNTDRLDPSYHTRLDTADYLEEEGMEAVKTVLLHFIEQWDREH